MGILAVQLLAVWTLLSTSSEFSRILLNHTPTIYQPYINHISTMDSEWTHPYPSQPRLHVDRADDLQPHKDTFFVSFWVPELKIPKWFNSYLSIYAAYDHIWSYMIIYDHIWSYMIIYVPGFFMKPHPWKSDIFCTLQTLVLHPVDPRVLESLSRGKERHRGPNCQHQTDLRRHPWWPTCYPFTGGILESCKNVDLPSGQRWRHNEVERSTMLFSWEH